MSQITNISIRPAVAGDEDFIVSLVPRLAAFGPPAWRDAASMIETDIAVLRRSLHEPEPGTALFVAEDGQGARLGFMHLKTGSDYYEKEPHGHLADLVVAPEGEGRGLGRRLLEHAEEWARAQGFRRLTLSVFARNTRAREVYRRMGYGEDVIKYFKEIE